MTRIQYKYAPASVAIENLRKEGFVVDFNLEENCIICGNDKYDVDDFEIVQVYRYEGDSNPSDESTVYGIHSKDGTKGILVTAYGAYTDSMSTALLRKLALKDN
ncbi:MAG: hypothetical protein AB7D46_04335 [Flavobacteriaceae bacterium]